MLKNTFPRRSLLAAAAILSLGAIVRAGPEDPIRVVATIPDLANFAEVIGGNRVQVKSLSRGTEDLHRVPVRPSMLIALSRADLFLEVGLSMEVGWIPELLIKANNRRIRPGSPGFKNCSVGWEAIQVPAFPTRAIGDVHPQGNPHMNIDPLGGLHLATKVHEALVEYDPEHREGYDERFRAWRKRYDEKKAYWDSIGEKLKGRKAVVYHMEFNYFTKRVGMDVPLAIEPQPGMPPTPGHVAKVIKMMREQEVELILTAGWSNNRVAADVARKSGATVLELPNQVKGASWAGNWIDMMTGIYERVAEALDVEVESP